MRWPPPRAQTAQPERWRMRRWSKEPRRMSVVKGRVVVSLARASRVLSLCLIYIHETIKDGLWYLFNGFRDPVKVGLRRKRTGQIRAPRLLWNGCKRPNLRGGIR